MTFLVATEARKNLFQLIDDVALSHEPAIIKGKRNSAVLICIEDWDDIKETFYLQSIDGLAKSILEASNEPIEDSIEYSKIEW